jgi:hypothetical protein
MSIVLLLETSLPNRLQQLLNDFEPSAKIRHRGGMRFVGEGAIYYR